MNRCTALIVALALFPPAVSQTLAQSAEGLKIFGYFQNTFAHQTSIESDPEQNSFSMQQQNLFFRRELTPDWRAFVNIEFLNSFSTSRRWGAANLEEMWVRYRSDEKFSLKLGLLIPIFNNLHEIKNRTPLLPYIIRPLVYETSFSEFIAIEEYLPARAYAQAYGYLPWRDAKLDYAVFLGNSPNINSDPDGGQTGADTTDTFLIGGRLGLRYDNVKLGFSTARDHVNSEPVTLVPGEAPFAFEEVTRTRFGADLSFDVGDFTFESEFISVSYDDDNPAIRLDKEFYYATIGYRPREELLVYASYWLAREDFTEFLDFLDPPRLPPATATSVSPMSASHTVSMSV